MKQNKKREKIFDSTHNMMQWMLSEMTIFLCNLTHCTAMHPIPSPPFYYLSKMQADTTVHFYQRQNTNEM
jgi:hypothetical protein